MRSRSGPVDLAGSCSVEARHGILWTINTATHHHHGKNGQSGKQVEEWKKRAAHVPVVQLSGGER